MASGAGDVDEPVKRRFFKKIGKRVGNVFSKKRNSQTSALDNDFSFPPPQQSSTCVTKNPLVATDIPSHDVYAPLHSQNINVPAGRRALSGFYDDVGGDICIDHGELSSPERCLSEGDLVESSAAPRSEKLGGRVWRAVPGSMDNLPKSLMGELNRKIGTRGHSGSEDEGLPHSPPTDYPLTSSEPPPASLSHSSKSLTSCGESSDGERAEELDFNALRRAESLDNTAAKHRIQVGRQRRKAAGPGALRKHKSCTMVQLAGITEEAPCKDEMQVPFRRQNSHDSSMLICEEVPEIKEKDCAAHSLAVPVLRPVRKTTITNPPVSVQRTEASIVYTPSTTSSAISAARSSTAVSSGSTDSKGAFGVLLHHTTVTSSNSNPTTTTSSGLTAVKGQPFGVALSTVATSRVSSSVTPSSAVISSTTASSGVTVSKTTSARAASSTVATPRMSNSAIPSSKVISSTTASSGVTVSKTTSGRATSSTLATSRMSSSAIPSSAVMSSTSSSSGVTVSKTASGGVMSSTLSTSRVSFSAMPSSAKVSSTTVSSGVTASNAGTSFPTVTASRVSSSSTPSSAVASSVQSSIVTSSTSVASSGARFGSKCVVSEVTSSSTASAEAVSSTVASRIGKLRSMFSSEPSTEPVVRPASSASSRPPSRTESSPARSRITKAASVSGPKCFTVPAEGPQPSVTLSSAKGLPASATASDVPGKTATGFSKAKRETPSDEKSQNSAEVANLSSRKSGILPTTTSKVPESINNETNVLLREKDTGTSEEGKSDRRVSRVMDLVKNFQRLQESSTS